MDKLAISFEDVVQARIRVRIYSHHTPVFTSRAANGRTGANLYFKCENFQRTGSFKFRGAYNSVAQLGPVQLVCGVISYSSGNHAQAVANAARLIGTKAVILMPKDAPKIKVDATIGYGAEVIFYDRYTEDREALCHKLALERDLTLIPPYDHPPVMAGQGTVAHEFMEDVGSVDVLIAPLGGGGLLSGCAIVAKRINPKCLVIGVEPEAGNDGQQSFRSGKIVHIKTPATIADGAQTQHLGKFTFPVIQSLVDDIVTVSDAELIQAMSFFASRMKMIVEPTGCLAAAAVLSKKLKVSGKKVGIILSGGNVDLQQFASFIKT